MACNTCRNACGDCSEGGITFKRGPRPVLPQATPVKPPASPSSVPATVMPAVQLVSAQEVAA